MTVAVLFARRDSVYKTLPDCDVWDEGRDVRNWPGGLRVVAHPPCRLWGRLRHFSKADVSERQLAIIAVGAVRNFGGVLEDPAESTLWHECMMPRPGRFPDAAGGWAFAIDQFHFGHKAAKPTWLYIVGCEPNDLPPIPQRQGKASHVTRPHANGTGARFLTKSEREHTPVELARWLVEVARRSKPGIAHPVGRPLRFPCAMR